uniref:sn-glycerol-3-phosphate ABC transporter ATP-binding protein UgpC n=1 Tax=Coralloluteibacterium stylophorae TaxID=1776034 RepID=A0A8J7VQV8_9GAMM
MTGVGKTFGTSQVIDDVALHADAGEFVVFVGPSGCGKSTLLRLIAGLETPDTGSIRIDERDVTRVHPAQRGVAMVFQSYALYPHMSVADNMGFGLRIRGEKRAAIREQVAHAARILQLEHLLDRKPRQLSGGQRQRVAIGRAIVRQPEIFLFDEPLSNLDAALRGQMRIELARLHAQLGATMVYVTHDQVEAMTLASRIVVLNRGRVEQIGAPLELYRRPANRFVAGFLGAPRMNFLAATAHARDGGDIVVDLARGGLRVAREAAIALDEGALTVGIRPEDLRPVADGAPDVVARGEVTLVERLGSEAIAYDSTGPGADDTLTLKLAGDATLAARETVALAARPGDVHLFDAAGRAVGAPA